MAVFWLWMKSVSLLVLYLQSYTFKKLRQSQYIIQKVANWCTIVKNVKINGMSIVKAVKNTGCPYLIYDLLLHSKHFSMSYLTRLTREPACDSHCYSLSWHSLSELELWSLAYYCGTMYTSYASMTLQELGNQEKNLSGTKRRVSDTFSLETFREKVSDTMFLLLSQLLKIGNLLSGIRTQGKRYGALFCCRNIKISVFLRKIRELLWGRIVCFWLIMKLLSLHAEGNPLEHCTNYRSSQPLKRIHCFPRWALAQAAIKTTLPKGRQECSLHKEYALKFLW